MRLLAEVKLFGEKAVPWSTPYSFLGGKPGGDRRHVHKRDPRLVAWQDSLRAACRAQYGLEPYLGPVMLSLVFHKATTDQSLWGTRWWSPRAASGHGDLTNLLKGAEDAITTFRQWKGTGKNRVLVFEIPGLIANDSQTCDGFTRKRWGPSDGVEVRVYAVLEED